MTNFSKYKDKGLSGLANLGNTCFLNSTMQILSHTYELNNLLNDPHIKEKLNKNIDMLLLLEWDELRKLLWNSNCIAAPNKFVQTVQKIARKKNMELFTGYDQNDMPEFLIFIIDCFHNALTREVVMTISGNIIDETDKIAKQCFETIKKMYEKDYSEIWKIFYATQVSQLTEQNTNQLLSMIPEPFFILNLPIPFDNKSPNLYDCFDLYVNGELLNGDNQVLNEKTGQKVDAIKNTMFWSLPTILVIDIKRFNSANRKNQILVDFPLDNLDLSKYVIGYNKQSYIYDLYAVCNHSGSVMGGHYTSFVKNANCKWYHFNDTNVSEVSNLDYIVSPKAYCFFYRKRV